jgi:hypothetical protein
MADQWNEPLQCPQCRRSGLASLSQPVGAEMPIVDRVSDGFKAVHTEYGRYRRFIAGGVLDPLSTERINVLIQELQQRKEAMH